MQDCRPIPVKPVSRLFGLAAAFMSVSLVTTALCPVTGAAQDATRLTSVGVAASFATDSFASVPAYNTASLDCMTAAIAYEAGNQPIEGQQAVGQVIVNRLVRSRYPKSVCGVVFAGYERRTGCQFTFTCDGSMRRRLQPRTIANARTVAIMVLSGSAPDRVSGATHYHANYVRPYWAHTGVRSAVIGAHIFYRMPGDGSVVVPGEGMVSDETAAAMLAHRAVGGQVDFPAAVETTVAPREQTAVTPSDRQGFSPWGLPLGQTDQR